MTYKEDSHTQNYDKVVWLQHHSRKNMIKLDILNISSVAFTETFSHTNSFTQVHLIQQMP